MHMIIARVNGRAQVIKRPLSPTMLTKKPNDRALLKYLGLPSTAKVESIVKI